MQNNIIRRTDIFQRLIISFLIVSIIPLAIVGYVSYNKSAEAVRSKTSTYSVQIMDQLSRTITEENRKYGYLGTQLAMDTYVQEGLKNYGILDAFNKMEISTNLNKNLSQKWEMLNHVKSIHIQTTEGETFYDLGFDYIGNAEIKRLIRAVDTVDQHEVWDRVITQRGQTCLVMARQVIDSNNWSKVLGYIIVSMEETAYSSILQTTNMGEGSEVLIINPGGVALAGGNILNQPLHYDPSSNLVRELYNHHSQQKYTFDYKINDRDFFVAYSYDTYSSWYIVSLIPYSYLNNETGEIKQAILLIGTICIALSLILIFFITRSISTPLRKLVSSMNKVSGGNLQVEVIDQHTDEIGKLSYNFNRMIRQIRELIYQTERVEKQKRETELQMLQAQINPHFLFNTLNSLKWTAMLSQAESVSNGIGALAELLRNTIVDKNSFVPLKEEINNIRNYIIIQRMRYGDSFEVEYRLDAKLEEAEILKFLIQPIVENAIIHGITEMDELAKITIECREEKNDLIISIRDNGKGMTEEEAFKLMDSEERSTKRLSNIGIYNVLERIQLHFGKRYGLFVTSVPGEGTEVKLVMPLLFNIRRENDDENTNRG